ncbi:hypothetical protein B7494_g3102 [Chlorociboria aeruginascens]|nr:hypothetical protein B7494_g3102 [Chlorociboria aeruginascens]
MDYPYYAPAQPYQFIGLPPTPEMINSGHSDDFSNSPPVCSRHPLTCHPLTEQDTFEQFPGYDAFNFVNHLAKPPSPPSTQPAPKSSTTNHAFEMPLDLNNDAARRESNSDDDMTPAQSRRKEQNRAAQRAFRERKERHVKDLEAKLAALEKNSASVAEENSRLKLQLQRAATENEILKATSGNPRRDSASLPTAAGPMQYSPTIFYNEVLHAHENKVPSHRIVMSEETGERLLAAGATWDFIIKHPLYQKGMVDVGVVSEKLKGLAQCDGQGPVFEERAIMDAIEMSVASGSDELL